MASAFAFKPNAVKLHAVIDEPVAELFGDLTLELFEFGIDEFDDFAGFDIDQMIVMCLWRCFVAGAAIAEIVTVKDACLFEQADRAIDRSNRNTRIDSRCALVQFFHVGMVFAFRQDARNGATLVGDAQSTFCAKSFNVDRLVHWDLVIKRIGPPIYRQAGHIFNRAQSYCAQYRRS